MMDMPGWRTHHLPLPDHEMTGYEKGDRPTLVFVNGGYDSVLHWPLAELFVHAYLLRDAIPRARLVFLHECGRCVWSDQPEATFREIDTFLQSGGVAGG